MNNSFKIFIIYLFSYTLLKSSCAAELGIAPPLWYSIGLSLLSMVFSICIVDIKNK